MNDFSRDKMIEKTKKLTRRRDYCLERGFIDGNEKFLVRHVNNRLYMQGYIKERENRRKDDMQFLAESFGIQRW